MKLEWDEAKRQRALEERGLDFADVAVFDWSNATIVDDVRFDYGERRELAFGLLKGRLCVVCFVRKGQGYRIVSLRKANAREQQRYGK